VSVVVHAMAQARGVLDEHAIKQIDRLMSNQGVEPWRMFGPWVAEVVGERKAIVVAMDWTDFDVDDQTTLALSLVTRHGRATPLVWLTVFKAELNDKLFGAIGRSAAEGGVADRGFGDTKLFTYLTTLGFGHVIRFGGNIHVAAADGER